MLSFNFVPDSLKPFAKFIQPAFLLVLAAAVYALINGEIDTDQMEVALQGLGSAIVAFCVANGSVGWQKFAKAISAAFLAVVTVGIHSLVLWQWDATSTRLALTGLVSAILVYATQNGASEDLTDHQPTVPPGMQV